MIGFCVIFVVKYRLGVGCRLGGCVGCVCMYNDFYIVLLLFVWVSMGLIMFVVLDVVICLLGGLMVVKCCNWCIVCVIIFGIGLWLGFWFG